MIGVETSKLTKLFPYTLIVASPPRLELPEGNAELCQHLMCHAGLDVGDVVSWPVSTMHHSPVPLRSLSLCLHATVLNSASDTQLYFPSTCNKTHR